MGNAYCVGSIGTGVFGFGHGVKLTAGPDTDGSVVLLVKCDSTGGLHRPRPFRFWQLRCGTGTGSLWENALLVKYHGEQR